MSKEEMREGFEAWHCEQYKTKHTTGAPTRDMHGGVYDEKYGPPKQQALWECWQSTGGDVAKVEALKDEIERIEEGKQPVAWFRSDALGCAVWKPGATQALKDGDPLFTRSDAGEVERLRDELETLRQQHAEQSCIFCNDSGELLTEVKTLRAKLAERDSLLTWANDVLEVLGEGEKVRERIAALSASAESANKESSK